jgi:hypothetical protein
VSSLSSNAAGEPTTVNVATDPVPATMTGNTETDAKVALPSPCFAPIVFVTSGGGNWAAVTGRRAAQTAYARGVAGAGSSRRPRTTLKTPEPSATPARMSTRPSAAFRWICSSRSVTP